MLLSGDGKKALQELLKSGCLERVRAQAHYDRLLLEREAAQHYLAALDLTVRVDEVRGLIFVRVEKGELSEEDARIEAQTAGEDEADEWSHPLVRRQRLTLEQSLLLAVLRQRFVEVEQQQGIGYDDIRADWDDVKAQFFLYIEASGSEAKDDERLHTVIKQLGEHGLVGKVAEGSIPIRPLIVHVADPDNLTRLLAQLQSLRVPKEEGQ